MYLSLKSVESLKIESTGSLRRLPVQVFTPLNGVPFLKSRALASIGATGLLFQKISMARLRSLPNAAATFFFLLFSWFTSAQNQKILSETKLSNNSLLWGPYRPNLYFGVRPRIPKSLLTGLLWSKVDNFQDVQNSTLICLHLEFDRLDLTQLLI